MGKCRRTSTVRSGWPSLPSLSFFCLPLFYVVRLSWSLLADPLSVVVSVARQRDRETQAKKRCYLLSPRRRYVKLRRPRAVHKKCRGPSIVGGGCQCAGRVVTCIAHLSVRGDPACGQPLVLTMTVMLPLAWLPVGCSVFRPHYLQFLCR
jgi:hypothetical protein